MTDATQVKEAGINGCILVAARALDFLSDHQRPIGGQQEYNAEHLVQIAHELRQTAALRAPSPAVLDPVTVEALKSAKNFFDNEFSETDDLRRKHIVSTLCDKIDRALLAQPTGRPEPSEPAIELLEAGNAFRDALIPRADGYAGHAPLWHGWAIMDAFIAGSKYAPPASNPQEAVTSTEGTAP